MLPWIPESATYTSGTWRNWFHPCSISKKTCMHAVMTGCQDVHSPLRGCQTPKKTGDTRKYRRHLLVRPPGGRNPFRKSQTGHAANPVPENHKPDTGQTASPYVADRILTASGLLFLFHLDIGKNCQDQYKPLDEILPVGIDADHL